MTQRTFEDVWQLLAERLTGKIIPTLVERRRNRIISFQPRKMIRQTQTIDGKGWKSPTAVGKSYFRGLWQCLDKDGACVVQEVRTFRIAAACLAHVPELGVEVEMDGDRPMKPLTLRLKRSSKSQDRDTSISIEHGKPAEYHIVVDPKICSGKPTVRGTRIMVKNILGMLAGGYTVERILQAYPELAQEDIGAVLERT